MLAEVVDAVIGIDTHRDSHEAEIADPAGRPIATVRAGNDSAGFARLLAAIAKTAPGPRVAVYIEGTRSYGIGLARALAAAGLLVIECEQPARKRRRGRGQVRSDRRAPGGAGRAAPGRRRCRRRGGGDREALRILLVARQEITEASTAQASRLRALLLAGDDADRQAARKALTQRAVAALAGRLAAGASREHAVRHAEIGRLALALSQARRQLKDNRAQLLAIVEDTAPGLTSRYGIGPVSAAQAIASFSHPGRCRSEAAFAALGGTSPIPASSGQTIRHRLNRGGDRALNRASCAIAVCPVRSCPAPALMSAAHTRRKDHPGNPPLPQAVHRRRALPAAQPVNETTHQPLTNIEASEGRVESLAPIWQHQHA